MTTKIILGAGTINSNLAKYFGNINSTRVPLSSKPSILSQIEKLINKFDLVLVINSYDSYTKNLVQEFFPEVSIAEVQPMLKISDSILSGLKFTSQQEDIVEILFSDTITNVENLSLDSFVAANYEKNADWTMASFTETETIFYDKKNESDGNLAVVGEFSFSDKFLLQRICENLANSKNLANDDLKYILEKYNLSRRLIPTIIEKESWFDLGSLNGYQAARKNLSLLREFNSLKISNVSNHIIKSSVNREKILDEISWYDNLETSAIKIAPNVFASESVEGVKYEMEWIDFPTLAEFQLSGIENINFWKTMLNSLDEFLLNLHMPSPPQEARKVIKNNLDIFLVKTIKRIEDFRYQFYNTIGYKYYENLLNISNENISAMLKNLNEKIPPFVEALNQTVTQIHGDLIFSNLFYDPTNGKFLCIDPRGRWGNHRTVFGNPIYDFAKLSQSMFGKYEFISANLFRMDKEQIQISDFRSKEFLEDLNREFISFFKRHLSRFELDIRTVRQTECLLWLSLASLHRENPRRQIFAFRTGYLMWRELWMDDNG